MIGGSQQFILGFYFGVRCFAPRVWREGGEEGVEEIQYVFLVPLEYFLPDPVMCPWREIFIEPSIWKSVEVVANPRA